MEEDRQVARLWRVSKTIRELVRDRGYIITEDEINVSLDSFRSSHGGSGSVDRTQMNFFTTLADNPEEKLFVFFSPEPSVTTKIIRQLVDVLEQKNIRRGIIIWSEKMSPAAKKAMDGLRQEYHMEDFDEAYLLVNITQHHLVPKHEVLSPEAKKALLARYRLKETQLPRIQATDPVARYFGLARGQVVKITRASETSGRYCSYRVCM